LERLRTELLASKSAAEQAQLIAEENARARQSADEKRARKERWMDRLIGDLDREFPGIAGAVVQREMSTAETMHQYLNTPGGAVYGFAPQGSPAEAFAFTPRTHIAGLWLASAFTFGGGFLGAMIGAAHAEIKAAQ